MLDHIPHATFPTDATELHCFCVKDVEITPQGARPRRRYAWFVTFDGLDRLLGIQITETPSQIAPSMLVRKAPKTMSGLTALIGRRTSEIEGAPIAVCEAHLALRKFMPHDVLTVLGRSCAGERQALRDQLDSEPKMFMPSPLRSLAPSAHGGAR